MTNFNRVKFPAKNYRIGYVRDNDGGESIFIVERDEDEAVERWTEGYISHAFYFKDRLEFNRLETLIDSIEEKNEKFYEESCFADSSLTYPTLSSDLVIHDEQAAVIFRDYEYPVTESSTAVIPLHPSDYARTLSLVANGVLKVADNSKTNISDDKFDVDNPDSRLIALTLASVHIGRKTASFDSGVMYQENFFRKLGIISIN